MIEFAQIVHLHNGPLATDQIDRTEKRVTRFFLHPGGEMVRVSVHVYSPADMERADPIVVDIVPGTKLVFPMVTSTINYRLRNVTLRDVEPSGATEYALFRGTGAVAQSWASTTATGNSVPPEDAQIRPMLYMMFDQAIKSARYVAQQLDIAAACQQQDSDTPRQQGQRRHTISAT